MSDRKMLIVVDPQIDFISGSLPVPGAAEAMNQLADYVKANGDDYALMVVTNDWHPYDHCSFAHERDLADIFPGESAEKAYHNHFEYYCPCFIHIGADGGVDAFVEKEHWQFRCPTPQNLNWLWWQSGFTAGVICALLSEGITAEQMRTIDHDTMQKIVNTAFLLADNASGETNCIDAKMALKMQQAINEATTDE